MIISKNSFQHPPDLQSELLGGDLDIAYAAALELLEVWDRLRQAADWISAVSQDELSKGVSGFVEGLCLFTFDWYRKRHSGFGRAIRDVELALSACRATTIPLGTSGTPFGESVAATSMTEMLLNVGDDLWFYLNQSIFKDKAIKDFACFLDDSISKLLPSTGGREDWILPDVCFDHEMAHFIKEEGLAEEVSDLESLFSLDCQPLIITSGENFKVLTTRLRYSSTLKKAAAALQKAAAFFNFDAIECEVRREFAAATAFRCQLGLTNRGIQPATTYAGTNEILENRPQDKSSPWDVCFKNPRRFVWHGKGIRMPPREYRFLYWLLNNEQNEIPFDDAFDACWGYQHSDKTLQNTVVSLNNLLEPLQFPIVFSTSSGHIHRMDICPGNFPANAGRTRDAT